MEESVTLQAVFYAGKRKKWGADLKPLSQNNLEKSEAQKRGMILGLSNMTGLMEELGNPQEHLRFLHIAGTNGKGSTAAFLRMILQKAGYVVGQYLSPGVICEREIIQVQGERISPEEYEDYFAKVSQAAKEAGISPTMFELETAMAFVYFFDKKCDFVVLECGLGGDLDATNVVTTTVCSVFASISLDHTAILGHTTAEIAFHKAGIMKENAPAAALWNEDESVRQVLEEQAAAKSCPLVWAKPAGHYEIREDVPYIFYGEKEYELGLLGTFQEENATLALTVIDVLRSQGIEIPEEAVRAGLKEVRWPGRMQVISRNPLVILDGGHNPAAAKALRATMEMYFTNRKILYIIGMLRDKDYPRVLAEMMPLGAEVFVITPDSPRALTKEELKEAILEQFPGRKVCEAETPMEALAMAQEAAKEEDVILAFGSFTFLGELLR